MRSQETVIIRGCQDPITFMETRELPLLRSVVIHFQEWISLGIILNLVKVI